MINALTMLNETGDVTITWTSDQDDEMEAIIARKMKEGITFFVIERRLDGLPDGRFKLDEAPEARKHRALAIRDEDLLRFVEGGKGDVAKTSERKVRAVRRAASPRDAATNETVGVRQRAGG